MNEQAELLIKYFATISSTADNNARKNVESEMEQFLIGKDCISITEIIINSNHPNPLKNAACKFMKIFAKRGFGVDELSSSTRKEMITKIIAGLRGNMANYVTKEEFASIIVPIANKHSSISEAEKTKSSIYKEIFSMKNFSDASEIIGLLIGLEALASTHNSITSIACFYRDHTINFIEFCNNIVNQISPTVLGARVSNLIESPIIVEQAVIIKYLARVVYVYTESVFVHKSLTYITKIANDTEFITLFQKLLLVSAEGVESVFSVTGNEALDTELNEAASLIIKIYKKYLKLYTTNNTSNYQSTLVFQQIGLNSKILLSQIFNLAVLPDFCLELTEANTTLGDIVMNSLDLLNAVTLETSLLEAFSDVYTPLIVHVLLPLLKTTDNEKDDIYQDPQEFFAYSHDICYRQKSKTVKSKAMKLLENLATNVDPAATFSLMKMIYILDFCVSSKKEDTMDSYQGLSEFQGSKFAQFDKEGMAEISLLVLTTLSPIIMYRTDMMETLNNLLKNFQTSFIMSPSIIIKVRLYHFLSYYFEALLDKESFKDSALAYLKHICEILTNTDELNEPLRFAAISTISNIMKMGTLTKKKGPNLGKIHAELINGLISVIETNGNEELFSLFFTLVDSEIGKVLIRNSNQVLQFLTKLQIRCIAELENPTLINKPDLFVNQIWNIFKAVGNSKLFIPAHANTLDTILVPLMEISFQKKTTYDEDIMELMNEILEKCNDLPPNLTKMVSVMKTYFNRYEKRVTCMLKTCNLLMIHKIDVIKNPEILQNIVEMGIEGLSTRSPNLGDSYAGESALLLHLLIMYCNDALTPEQFKAIFEEVSNQFQTEEIKEKFFVARLYGLYLAAFIYVPEAIAMFLKASNTFESVLNSIVINSYNFKTTYDRKLLVLGLINILRQSMGSGEFSPLAVKLIRYISSNLLIGHCAELIKAYGKERFARSDSSMFMLYQQIEAEMKREAGNNDSPMDDYDQLAFADNEMDNEIFGYMMGESIKSSSAIALIKSPLDDKDEYSVFKSICDSLKNSIGRDNILIAIEAEGGNYLKIFQTVVAFSRIDTKVKDKEPTVSLSRKVVKRKKGVSKPGKLQYE